MDLIRTIPPRPSQTLDPHLLVSPLLSSPLVLQFQLCCLQAFLIFMPTPPPVAVLQAAADCNLLHSTRGGNWIPCGAGHHSRACACLQSGHGIHSSPPWPSLHYLSILRSLWPDQSQAGELLVSIGGCQKLLAQYGGCTQWQIWLTQR